MSEFDLGFVKLVFDDEKGEAFAFKRDLDIEQKRELDSEMADYDLIHDYVYEDGYEDDEDLFGDDE